MILVDPVDEGRHRFSDILVTLCTYLTVGNHVVLGELPDFLLTDSSLLKQICLVADDNDGDAGSTELTRTD